MKTANIETTKKIGEEVELAGWVHSRRDHGKIIFIDLRDRTGLLQIVFDENLYEKAKTLGSEFVIKIKGLVKERPEGAKNEKIPTGTVEIEAKDVEILAQAKTPPFDPTEDTRRVNEDKRMEYRYIDIRSQRMTKNLELRSRVIKFLRNFLDEKGFLEIETPDLTKSTPEGARDYLVPARTHPGQFYALPQSPQQFKQLLMVAGIEKYYQIARCFRDEDPRGDRQPEHTQLDLEMSFVEQKDVMKLNEELLIALIKEIVPDKKIAEIPFPIMTYQNAMEKYKTDRPDLRKDKNDENELAFCWVIDFPFFKQDSNKKWTFTHNPFSDPMPDDKEKFLKGEIEKTRTSQYDIVLNGSEIGGGSIRSHQREILSKVFEVLGYSKKEAQEKFGHMLKAFEYGVPPHGGIAWGLDRLVSIFANEKSIREVIAFPKTGDGRDLMMGAPGDVDEDQLKDLQISTSKKK